MCFFNPHDLKRCLKSSLAPQGLRFQKPWREPLANALLCGIFLPHLMSNLWRPVLLGWGERICFWEHVVLITRWTQESCKPRSQRRTEPHLLLLSVHQSYYFPSMSPPKTVRSLINCKSYDIDNRLSGGLPEPFKGIVLLGEASHHLKTREDKSSESFSLFKHKGYHRRRRTDSWA